jgi:hypothetical protein
MNKVISVLFFIMLFSSCAIQKKSVELANGELVTQKKYNKMLSKAFKNADKQAKKTVKGVMNKKQIKNFRKEVNTTFISDSIK